jgi:beta-lactamase regulating signal transducer with metallopeptidase domain
MTEWILSSCILILTVIVLRTLLKGRISLRLQYALWGLVLLRLLIPISFGSSDISVANLAVSDTAPQLQTTVNANTQQLSNHSHEDLEQQTKDNYAQQGIDVEVHVDGPVNWKSILRDALPVVWFIGFVSVAGLFLFTNARFKRKIMDSRYSLDIRKNNLEVYATGGADDRQRCAKQYSFK